MTNRGWSAQHLKLPYGLGDCAWIFGPLRVTVQYRINNDAHIARFDSVLDQDQQYNCAFEQDIPSEGSMTARDFGWLCFPFAMRAFREMKVSKGHQMAEPKKISFSDF